ncbi:hypothetical protein [Algihabitans sp.]|uniref:hypothetical protein n=1 Tax=Algihabitans sp. TaxID=2821514 RepID=UPI003BAD7084
MEIKSTRWTFLSGMALAASSLTATIAAPAETSPVFPGDYRLHFTTEAERSPATSGTTVPDA